MAPDELRPRHQPLPAIGLLGAPGSGKSTVARMFESLGCAVIDADRLAHEAMHDAEIHQTLVGWWGPGIMAQGVVDRQRLGEIVFQNPAERARLEGLVHPYVHRRRQALRRAVMQSEPVSARAVIEDCPLLIEAGLAQDCDAAVFVHAPLALRRARVLAERGWSADDLARREAAQAPLDTKRAAADYIVDNTGDRGAVRERVSGVLNQILQAFTDRRPHG